MYTYKVFQQLSNHEFLEVAQTTFLEDAEAIYARYTSATIYDSSGECLQSKNLTHAADAALFAL